jgi:microcystin-dependent protein
MTEPYIGEIRMFAGGFAPRGWAFCDGQLLAVSQYDALFSLFGTTYGGDGRTTFGLPDMRGRMPVHQGQGPGLTNRRIGAKYGSETVTLTTNEMPGHTHDVRSTTLPATTDVASGNVIARTREDRFGPGAEIGLAPNAIAATGGSQSHTNLMPAQCVYFIVALTGVYPSRQ